MGQPYEIKKYSIETLKDTLSLKSGTLKSIIDSKLHSLYFDNYFNHLNAKTILIENDYIDHDFMEDYAGFYARCFEKYDNKCYRLHFFNIEFTSRQFSYLLINKSRNLTLEKLQNSYLGFVIVKKLPTRLIGKTCLITYGSDNGRRVYPALRSYKIGLFGLDLKVNKTLAFQEQDRGTSACATSALWSLFQGTGKLYQHQILSPVEITKLATRIPDESIPRSFPSTGLTGRQMIYTIRQLNMEADYTDAQNEFNFQGNIYAYLKSGIPLILIVHIYDCSNPKKLEFDGGHAITISGFSLGRNIFVPQGSPIFNVTSTKIDKIYVHDDQVGPFARVVLDGQTIPIIYNGKIHQKFSLFTSWKGRNQIIGSSRFVPQYLLIPLNTKIRLRYMFVRESVMFFNELLHTQLLKNSPLFGKIWWDIYLTNVNSLKSELRKETQLDDKTKRKLLKKSMPKYIWRITMGYKSIKIFEILFDATDIEQGKFVVHIIEYNNPFCKLVTSIAKSIISQPVYHQRADWRIIEKFSNLY